MNIRESKMNAYDRIAPYYDALSSIIFGRSIRRSQECQIQFIPQDSRVLMLGGGTGWLLERVLRERPSCKVTYLESSQKMIEMARAKTPGASVNFIHGRISSIPENTTFDAIIADFFFDQFSTDDLRVILKRIAGVLRPGGMLMVADFVDDKVWKKAFLRVMYQFFFAFDAVIVGSLPPWDKLVREQEFSLQYQAQFYRAFICSNVYRNSGGTIAKA